MNMKQWYEELFENYAESYDKEPFTRGTRGEVDFIEQEINFDKTKRILDIGCGTGRHAVELAKRGYPVTGIDLSQSQLDKAIEKAKKESLNINFIRADARTLDFNNEFDAVIMICEGAFPLMETDEMNVQILEKAQKALKPGGKLILTTLNALFPLYHSTEEFLNEQGFELGFESKGHHFDPLTLRETSTVEITDDSGKKKVIKCIERFYMPSEMTWYLKSLHFKHIEIFGCKLGHFSRSDPLTSEDPEMLVIAEKGS
ncbi:MAG: methyltransferase domain-containing protein [Candidatus Aminicenantes bacterium]|nr:MAG: methyltransferase domain-containing protein [Candidatus Aminicenantes bacterium]